MARTCRIISLARTVAVVLSVCGANVGHLSAQSAAIDTVFHLTIGGKPAAGTLWFYYQDDDGGLEFVRRKLADVVRGTTHVVLSSGAAQDITRRSPSTSRWAIALQ